ncbi:MAG: HD domain-containing protein [Bacilli bacterium]|nr:HD domain-containing protein [Bacilli bacterium]
MYINRFKQEPMSEEDKIIYLSQAIDLACTMHKDQKRKGGEQLYLTHLVKVQSLLSYYRQSVICRMAGICHDLLEDTDASYELIERKLGRDTADIVLALTLDKKLGWRKAREAFIDYYANIRNFMGEGQDLIPWYNIWTVKVADAICNLQDMYLEYPHLGDKLFDRFNAPKEEQAWYYASILIWAEVILKGNFRMQKAITQGKRYFCKIFGEEEYYKNTPNMEAYIKKWSE